MRRGCPYTFVPRSGDHIVKYFLVLTLACLLTATPGHADTPAATPEKAVLVTGASTGIGRKSPSGSRRRPFRVRRRA
jgi:hypothetical protein